MRGSGLTFNILEYYDFTIRYLNLSMDIGASPRGFQHVFSMKNFNRSISMFALLPIALVILLLAVYAPSLALVIPPVILLLKSFGVLQVSESSSMTIFFEKMIDSKLFRYFCYGFIAIPLSSQLLYLLKVRSEAHSARIQEAIVFLKVAKQRIDLSQNDNKYDLLTSPEQRFEALSKFMPPETHLPNATLSDYQKWAGVKSLDPGKLNEYPKVIE